MSRIGKQPITVPANVQVRLENGTLRVEGPKGKLELRYHANMRVIYDDQTRRISVERPNDDRLNRSLHGLTRTLINNMIVGVTQGFERRLKVEGIGYQARLEQGKDKTRKPKLVLSVGFSHPVILDIPPELNVEVPDPNTIVVRGCDKQKVGEFAAEIRHVRPPEPYKGKGIRYENEVVRRKQGKAPVGAGG
ncbi:MAG: 50S ribosomal protein L6 [Gemmatales bacterium]|nr:50S ribosomal protein L6 [Gemmatales bacterium]MDW8175095.1 50S ribosomal protein L6 [Gemmatales bacterium]